MSTIQQAATLHQQGRLGEAEQLYRSILQDQRDHFDALHLLGVLMHQRGRSEEALALIARAVAANTRSADAHANQGRVLAALSRFETALASFDLALALNAEQAELLLQRGNVLQHLNRSAKALESLDRALVLRPQYPEALHNRGVILHALNRCEEALASYDRALALLPRNPTVLNCRGATLAELGRLEEALASYDEALARQPDFVDALYNRGNVLKKLNRLDEAVASCDRAIALRPDYAEAHYNRANALHGLQRFDEALKAYDRAIAARPDYAEARSNRGNVLHKLNWYEEALASFDRALSIRADLSNALNNRGLTLKEMTRFDEAQACFERALAVWPDNAEAHWNDALLRLLRGDYGRGWAKYEWRWNKAPMIHARRNFAQPLWLGDGAIAGKTVLLHGEQGLGDSIQFCRYVPLVAARGARVILEVQAPLRELMGSLEGAARVVTTGEPLPDFDLHCPLLSLPLAFRTLLETIPSASCYLRAPAQRLADWRARLAPWRRPLIGLTWAGNTAHKNDHNRSIGLRTLLSLLDNAATFVSLQKDNSAVNAATFDERRDILDFGDALGNFSDTAALIAQLDLVISVDTGVAHLAGALGKPVWVLLNHVPDFRWLLDRDDSPWYPTARLFRQDAARTWDGVIARVRDALSDFVESRRE